MNIDHSLTVQEFPTLQKITYLNNAAYCPVPQRTACVLNKWSEKLTNPHIPPDVDGIIQSARESLSLLTGVEQEGIAFCKNTTQGFSMIASSLPFEPGDEVLIPQPDHPNLVLPFLNLYSEGISVRRIPWSLREGISTEKIIDNISARTRAVALSHVQWINGYRTDLRSLGEELEQRDLFFIVDAIQSVGVVPADISNWKASAVAAGGYKWLMGGRGNGFLYVQPELIDDMRPSFEGSKGVANASHDLEEIVFVPDARRFETGSYDLPSIDALDTSVRFILDTGVKDIWDRVLKLRGKLVRGLIDLGFYIESVSTDSASSSIISFSAGDETINGFLVSQLAKHDIYVALREGIVRCGLHFYNDYENIDYLLEVLEDLR